MKTIAIIGAGRLGTSLGIALKKNGYQIKAISCLSLSSARESSRLIGEGQPYTDNLKAAGTSRIIIITVPDDKIKTSAEELAAGIPDWEEKLVWHCSGLLPSRILDPLKAKGALTASVHPVQAFAKKNAAPDVFKGVYFSLEGSTKAQQASKAIIKKLSGHSFVIKEEDKPLYHAACSMASDFLIVLLESASSLLQISGNTPEQALKILLPLVQGTLQNVKNFNTRSTLTGPIARGDIKTISSQLEALRKHPPHYEMFLKLASQTLEMAIQKNKISSQNAKIFKALLEEK
jgi:predicted short-subunit dehydrogenase-like oxidoreductase (DUF2520 family)